MPYDCICTCIFATLGNKWGMLGNLSVPAFQLPRSYDLSKGRVIIILIIFEKSLNASQISWSLQTPSHSKSMRRSFETGTFLEGKNHKVVNCTAFVH